MAYKEGADEAIKEPNPVIDGRRANVNLAYLGAKNRAATMPRMLSSLIFEFDRLFSILVSYSLLARMPTYQSATYPYVSMSDNAYIIKEKEAKPFDIFSIFVSFE